jgi:hypothetical protein
MSCYQLHTTFCLSPHLSDVPGTSGKVQDLSFYFSKRQIVGNLNETVKAAKK